MKAAEDHGGWRVTIARITPRTGRGEPHVFGVRSRQFSKAGRAAAQKAGFLRVLKIEPLTLAQFEREFPQGRNGSANPHPTPHPQPSLTNITMKSKFTSCQAGALRRPVRILSVLLILSAFPLAAFAVTPTPTATPKPSATATPTPTPNPSPVPVSPDFAIAWDKNAETNITKYVVGYSTTSGTYTTTKDVTTGLTSNPVTYSFASMAPGTYYIAVKAVSANGSSPWSSQIAALVTPPLPATPNNLRITVTGLTLNLKPGKYTVTMSGKNKKDSVGTIEIVPQR